MDTSVQSSSEQLHQRGYRVTPQRHTILRVLQEANAHLSIQQIMERMQQLSLPINTSTIYRTLELLIELGLVQERHFPGEPTTYEAGQERIHHHLVCRRCHAVLHVAPALPAHLAEQLQEQYTFHAVTLEVVAEGYCDACWEVVSGSSVVGEQ